MNYIVSLHLYVTTFLLGLRVAPRCVTSPNRSLPVSLALHLSLFNLFPVPVRSFPTPNNPAATVQRGAAGGTVGSTLQTKTCSPHVRPCDILLSRRVSIKTVHQRGTTGLILPMENVMWVTLPTCRAFPTCYGVEVVANHCSGIVFVRRHRDLSPHWQPTVLSLRGNMKIPPMSWPRYVNVLWFLILRSACSTYTPRIL